MWDTPEPAEPISISHAVPCTACQHESHQYLACSDTCACLPPTLPWLTAGATAA